jgi:hypothetical protein
MRSWEAIQGREFHDQEARVTAFIVHIGPHKTGTTYLQATLHEMRDDLSARGIHVPAIWDASADIPSHMKFAWAIRGGAFALLHEQVQAMLAEKPDYLVISCEALSRLDIEQIAGLRTLLGSAPVTIVYYVRRWPERLPSLWQENVKFGHDVTLPEFFTAQVTGISASTLWDANMLNRYAAVFGAGAIKVVSYSHLMDQNVDIAQHFFAEFLPGASFAIPGTKRHNRSLPITQTELIRALNAMHAASGGERSAALRNWFLREAEKLETDALLKAMEECVGTIRIDEAAQSFVPPFDTLVDRYGSCVVPPHHANGLYEVRAVEASFVRQNYLLAAPAVAALEKIYSAFIRSNSGIGC